MTLCSQTKSKKVLVECYKQVVEETRKSERRPENLFLGGISMGAAIASHVIADGADTSGVKGLFFFSYPLHRPGSPDALGDKHLHKISQPMILVSGTRDVYAEARAMKSVVSKLGPRRKFTG